MMMPCGGIQKSEKEDEFLSDLEKEARTHNLGYVEMDGNIGVIGNGAGLNMTTLDILRYYGGEPANSWK